jgi:hypothetical protein
MNDKQAKKLRRLARQQTEGYPERIHVTNRMGSVVLHPSCTRAVYQQLKKEKA